MKNSNMVLLDTRYEGWGHFDKWQGSEELLGFSLVVELPLFLIESLCIGDIPEVKLLPFLSSLVRIWPSMNTVV